jgi:hypothetical protein
MTLTLEQFPREESIDLAQVIVVRNLANGKTLTHTKRSGKTPEQLQCKYGNDKYGNEWRRL